MDESRPVLVHVKKPEQNQVCSGCGVVLLRRDGAWTKIVNAKDIGFNPETGQVQGSCSRCRERFELTP